MKCIRSEALGDDARMKSLLKTNRPDYIYLRLLNKALGGKHISLHLALSS